MKLSEFLMFCRLKGLIVRHTKQDGGNEKVMISNNTDIVYILYSGDTIIESELHRPKGYTDGKNFPLDMIVDVILGTGNETA